jgi:hypothetical protein
VTATLIPDGDWLLDEAGARVAMLIHVPGKGRAVRFAPERGTLDDLRAVARYLREVREG